MSEIEINKEAIEPVQSEKKRLNDNIKLVRDAANKLLRAIQRK